MEKFYRLKAWGLCDLQGIKFSLQRSVCPNCNVQQIPEQVKDWAPRVVGWSGTPEAKTQGEQVMSVGQLVIRCQACGQNYYFDCNEYLAWHVVERCPAWGADILDLVKFREKIGEEVEETATSSADPLQSWGFNTIEAATYAPSWKCPHCPAETPLNRNDRWKLVVGFRLNIFYKWGTKYAGEVIAECPSCSRKFWFHVWEETAEIVKKHCPNWPTE